MFYMGVDLGQSQDYTALAIVQQVPGHAPSGRAENHYHLRYLHRPDLGTSYPVIVAQVMGLLAQEPLSHVAPLVVDKTGVGRPVVDMFLAAGVRPRAITITGGMAVNRTDPYDITVPKRDLAGLLVSLYQGRRLKMAQDLVLGPVLANELKNFKLKVNIATGNESFEAWRESIHDDLVLAVAMACWYAETMPLPLPAIPSVSVGGGWSSPLPRYRRR